MKTLNPQIQNLNNPQQDKLKRLGEGFGVGGRKPEAYYNLIAEK